MEFASYLAGETWSDHPACTHPQLASLARMTNDCTSDAARSNLAALIPSVIGLRGDDSDEQRISLIVALRAATSALPVANLERQRALAVGILTCEHMLMRHSGGFSSGMRAQTRQAFAQAPDTEKWARHFIVEAGSFAHTKFTSRTADSIVRTAVQGIAEACDPDIDGRLNRLLTAAIDDCTTALAETDVAESATPTATATATAAESQAAPPLRTR
ncbi:hypothetical protein GCM10027056_31370 [Glaciibacter psychrotolerans]